MPVVSHVCLFATRWTVAHQAPLSMGFLRQEYWNGLPFPSPGDLPDPGIKPASPALAGRFFITEPPEKPILNIAVCIYRFQTPYTVGGNVNWYSHYGEQYGGSLKN